MGLQHSQGQIIRMTMGERGLTKHQHHLFGLHAVQS